jgi:hypothetical protein
MTRIWGADAIELIKMKNTTLQAYLNYWKDKCEHQWRILYLVGNKVRYRCSLCRKEKIEEQQNRSNQQGFGHRHWILCKIHQELVLDGVNKIKDNLKKGWAKKHNDDKKKIPVQKALERWECGCYMFSQRKNKEGTQNHDGIYVKNIFQ